MRPGRWGALATAVALVVSGLAVASPAQALETGPVPVLTVDSLDGEYPTFAWSPVDGAVAYSLQIASGTEVSSTVLANVRTTNTRWIKTGELGSSETGRTLYWRVAPYFGTTDSSIGEWSQWGSYDQPGTRVPTPLVPADGTTIAYPSPVSFSWTAVTGATSYEVQYTPEASGWTNATSITVKGGTTAAPTDLLSRTTTDSSTGTAEPVQRRWRVRANLFTASGTTVPGPWSADENRFTVTWPQSSAPRLLEPADIDLSDPTPHVVTDPTFRWTPVAGASAYRIDFGKDRSADRRQLINVQAGMSKTVPSTVYIPTTPLLDAQYYWQVTPLDAKGVPGPASDVYLFEKQWTRQSGPTTDDYPGTVYPEPLTGAADPADAVAIPVDKLVLQWEPVARATFYQVEVVPLDGRARLRCSTASTSVTPISTYRGGTSAGSLAQQSTGSCIWNSSESSRIKPGLYRWNVRAYDLAAGSSATIGTSDSTAIVSDISDPESQDFPERVRYINVAPASEPSTTLGVEESSTVVGSPGEPAPLLTWNRYTNGLVVADSYEVQIGLNSTITTNEVGTFTTTSTQLRPTGVFANNQVGKPYYWRVRAIKDGSYISDWSTTGSWSRANIPTGGISSAAAPDDPTTVILSWTPQIETAPHDGGNRGYAVTVTDSNGVIQGKANAPAEYPFYVLNNPLTGTKLPAGTYNVTVAPLDAAGTPGNASAPLAVVQPRAAATNLRSDLNGAAATFVWDASPRAKTYTLSYRLAGGPAKTVVTTGVTTATVPDLPIGEYEWWVTATDFDNVPDVSDHAAFTRPATIPALVTSDGAVLSTHDTGVAPIVLQWEAVPGASRYVVRIAPSSSSVASGFKLETTATSLAPTGATASTALRFGTEYQWQVTAVPETPGSTASLGTSSIRRFTVTTAPAKPSKPSVTVTGTDAQVKWTALTGANAGSPQPPRYDLRYRVVDPSGAGFEWTVVELAEGTVAHRVVGLEQSTSYEFALRAVNGEGASLWSDIQVGKTATVPGAVGSLAATPRLGQIDLTWTAPSSNGGSSVTGYRIEYRTGTAAWTGVTTTRTAASLVGLSKLARYEVRVAALNAVGQGPWSSLATSTLGLPSAPTSVKAARADRSATVTWAAPSSTGGAAVTGYVVEMRKYSASTKTWSSWSTKATTSASVRKAVLSSLANGTRHEVRVRAKTSLGTGSASGAVAFTPAGKPYAPTGVKASAVAYRKIKVSWTRSNANGSTISGYQVQYSTNGSTWSSLATAGSTATSYTWSKATKGKTYYFRVIATSNLGKSAPSSSARVVAR